MKHLSHIHVIDPDLRRRGRIAQAAFAEGYHAEIYESFEELRCARVQDGVLLVADDQTPCPLQQTKIVLQASGIFLPVLLYSTDPSARRIVNAVLGGALGYLNWPFDTPELQDALRNLQHHQHLIDRARRTTEALHHLSKLTRREREVLEALVEGSSNKRIANDLGISSRTVEIHRSNAMSKIEAASTAGAVKKFIYATLAAEDFVEASATGNFSEISS
jgi:FixJ family two-component response regulator